MKDFKCKLTASQLTSLESEIDTYVGKMYAGARTSNKLILACMESLQARLYAKANPHKPKQEYKITLPAHEALAMELFFRSLPVISNTTFEGITIHNLINEINKHYA